MSKAVKARKVDITWDNLNAKYNIVESVNKYGYYKISADEIKEFYEPRLAVKFVIIMMSGQNYFLNMI